MSENTNCKGCRGSVRVADKDIQNMLEEMTKSGNFETASDDLYGKRLKKCGTCKYLEYGNTCLQCGCIVHIRAFIAKSTCPHPSGSKW